MGRDPVVVAAARFDSPDGLALAHRHHDEMALRYPDEGPGKFSTPEDFTPPHGIFVIARDGGTAVGCGGLKKIDEEKAEIKRVYVAPPARGRGVARALMAALEKAAADLGYGRVWLETGTRQPEAIALYEKLGYRRIPPFGEFRTSPLSVCFEKVLA